MTTFPSSGTSMTLVKGLETACDIASNLKTLSTRYASTMASTTVSSAEMFILLDAFISAKTALTALAAMPGMDTFAQAQLGVTVSAGFTSMINAVTAAGAWIVTNFPKDGSGNLLAETFAADGTRVNRNFTPAQTAGLQSLLTALAATIS